MEGNKGPTTRGPLRPLPEGEPVRPSGAPGSPGLRPLRPGSRPRGGSTLRPPREVHNAILPLAVIISSCIHVAGFALFLMNPVARRGPVFREPMVVRLVELPKGVGGATSGTPGRTAPAPPPKVEEPPKPKNPKTTLPGKVEPPPKAGPSPVRTEKPGQALGLGHGGPAGLGGSGAGVILDEPTFQYEWYKARLEDLLRSHWKKPMASGQTISASVHFTITSTGDAQDVQIVNSSGVTAFDQSVIRAVYSSTPFPKFPPQFDEPKLGVLYTFELQPEGAGNQLSAPPEKPAKGRRG